MKNLSVLAASLLLACGGDATLGPVQTIDGRWDGQQNGYAVSINVSQVGNDVAGSASIGSTGGALTGTATGTFVYPDVRLTLNVQGFQPVDYIGKMSTTEAKIIGKMNGSGLTNVEMDLIKK
jgi:hypothetical protein